jgi:hypothetical protein
LTEKLGKVETRTADFESTGRMTMGVIAVLAGVFAVTYFISTMNLQVPSAPIQQLVSFTSNQNAYVFYAVASALFGTFVAALAIGFAGFVRQDQGVLPLPGPFLLREPHL